MTADEIRKIIQPLANSEDIDEEHAAERLHLVLIGEIAAQLAELNERLQPGNFICNVVNYTAGQFDWANEDLARRHSGEVRNDR